jgi:hypothetical protein
MIVAPERSHDPHYLDSIIGSYVPSNSMLFSESMLYGLRTMWWQEMIDEMRFDNESQGTVLSEEEFKESPFYREGLEWYEGATLGQMEVMAENHDRNMHFAQLTQNVSIFSGTGAVMVGGLIAGSLPDPLNFVPFIGLSRRVVKGAKLLGSVKTASNAFRSTKIPQSALSRTLTDVADPMIGAGIANLAIADKRSKFQEEHDAKMVLMDLAIGGGIGLGITGIKTIRGKLARVSPKTHADRIAMGMEQLEAGESLNLAPHPHKGFNYQNPGETLMRSPNGTVYSNAVVRVFDENYLDVDTLAVTQTEGSGNALLQEGLETANAMGYKGLFVKDEIVNDIFPVDGTEPILAEIGDSRFQLERVPEAEGVIITDTLTEADGVSWEYVDTNNQWAYDETNNIVAESIQDRIRESIGEFSQVTDLVKKSVDEIGKATKNVTDTITRVGDRVMDASNCLIKNG